MSIAIHKKTPETKFANKGRISATRPIHVAEDLSRGGSFDEAILSQIHLLDILRISDDGEDDVR